eukprot:2278557-Amphidinium_carterae.2
MPHLLFKPADHQDLRSPRPARAPKIPKTVKVGQKSVKNWSGTSKTKTITLVCPPCCGLWAAVKSFPRERWTDVPQQDAL